MLLLTLEQVCCTFSERKNNLCVLYERNYREFSSKRKLRELEEPFEEEQIALRITEGNNYMHTGHGITNLEQAVFKCFK
jgi:hypothetical protein